MKIVNDVVFAIRNDSFNAFIDLTVTATDVVLGRGEPHAPSEAEVVVTTIDPNNPPD